MQAVRMVKEGGLLVVIVVHLVHVGFGNPLTTVSVKAGENASLPCPGLSNGTTSVSGDTSAPGDYIVNQLVWSRCSGRKTCLVAGQSGQLVTYTGGKVTVQEDDGRLALDRRNWSLLISSARAADISIYSCAFNKQASDHNIIQLLVLDVPSPPGRPMVIRHESRLVDLSWAPSYLSNNAPIEYYVVQTRYGDNGLWPSVEAGQRTVDNQTNMTVSGLTPFTVYTFRVVAVNDLGYSGASDTSYPVITQRERPGAAPNLTYARNRSSTSIEVGWQPPANYTLHGEFTGYRLTWRPLEPSRRQDTPLEERQLHDVSLRGYLIEGLEPFTRYELTLQVKNPQDLSPADTITAVTAQGVPSRPENVTFSAVNDRSLKLSWTPPRQPNGLLLGYTVYWRGQGAAVKSRLVPDGDVASCTVATLEPDREYAVWLKARTVAGEGDRSFPVTVKTDVSGPGAPVVTNITCPTDTSLVLHWRRPQLIYGSVDMYYLLYRYDEDMEFVERTVPVRTDGLQFSIILPNLTSNEIYEVRVQGATSSRLVTNKVYKGQQSASAKVRIERHCQQIQLFSTWQHQPSKALASSQLTGILVGSLLVALTVIIAVLWRRRRLKRCPIDSEVKPAAAAGQPPGWPAPSHEAVSVQMFSQHVHQLHADGGGGLLRDWQSLQTAVPLVDKTYTNGAAHSDGLGTRVQLSSRLYRGRAVPVPPAYHVDGYRAARAFIVTERPGFGAASDAFWRLAWEQRVATVVCISSPQAATERLSPEVGQTQPSGDLEVRCVTERPVAGCVVTEVIVTKRKKERRLHLYQYTDCSESGLPDSPLLLLQLVRRTQPAEDAAAATATPAATTTAAPILLVTGPDGRGAGLYLGLSTLLTQLNRGHELAVLSYCQHIVGQCPRLLGTLDEYSLLHECLLERVSAGETLVQRDKAHLYMERLQGGGRDSFPYPTAEKQYKSAIALGARHFTVVSAAKPCNDAKNRSLSYIPMEPSRVLLPAPAALEGADYINASWLPGYRTMQEYILTQHPLPSTVLDFWQMIWHYRVTTVACLSPEGCGVFWPLEEEVIRGPGFIVRYMSESTDCSATYKTSWVIRSFLLQSTEGIDDVTARVVHLPLWPEESSIDSVMEGAVGARDVQADRLSPLVVMDRYGGTEGASFCLLSTVLRQLEQEANFDIFTVAKLFHQRRPGIWKNMREYLYLYHAVEAWLASRGHGTLRYRGGSCTSLCENRTPTEVTLNGVHGVMV